MSPTTEELKALLEQITGEYALIRQGREMTITGRVHVVASDEFPVAFVPAWDDSNDEFESAPQEALANARLIALAPTLAARVVALEEVVKVAQEALSEIDDKTNWEINPSNYDHDDVCNMNSDWCEIGNIAQAARAKLEDRA